MAQTSGFYARALRVIGQDLAPLVPENLVIELHGNNFVANGLCSKSRIDDSKSATAWRTVRKFFDRVADTIVRPPAGEPELEFVSFSRTYDFNEIDRLDEQGSNNRGSENKIPDIYTLAERLRTIGKIIDAQNGRITRIFKDLHQVIFEFNDADGKTHKQELNNTELYQLQQSYAAERRGSTADKADGG